MTPYYLDPSIRSGRPRTGRSRRSNHAPTMEASSERNRGNNRCYRVGVGRQGLWAIQQHSWLFGCAAGFALHEYS